jgi:hypothetical protein
MSPIPSFEAFHLRPGRDYLFRVTPRNRFGWGESVTTQVPVCVRDKCEMPDFVKMLPNRVKALRGSLLTLQCEASTQDIQGFLIRESVTSLARYVNFMQTEDEYNL